MSRNAIIDKESEFYNFVIVGGGSAGLTASIVAARKGFNVVILEKGEIAGPKPRGEGMRYFPLIDEILGKDFLQSITIYKHYGKVYHSPGDLHQVKVNYDNPGYFFEWRKFIDRFVNIAQDLGVNILLNSEVIEPIVKEGICIGVKYKDGGGKIQEIYGNVVFGCDGHNSTVGKYYHVSYDKLNCPIVKCLVSNANIDITKTPELQFYLIGNGDLEYAPNFPQCVAYIFPRGGKNAEVGLMLRMMKAFKMQTVKIPNEDEIMEVWENLKQTYPGFNELFKDAKIDYEELTSLTNAQMVKNFIPGLGAVLIGDSAGFVEASGSSGLYFSMEMAKFWVNIISKKLIELYGPDTEISEHNIELWSSQNVAEYVREFEKAPVYLHIKKVYSLISKFEWYIFKRRRTSERVNKRWKLISWILKKAG
jgi:flavin-dependent dehydrogenase